MMPMHVSTVCCESTVMTLLLMISLTGVPTDERPSSTTLRA